MAVLELDSDNFERSVSAAGILLIDCWARWCPACKNFEKVFEGVEARHPRHTFGRLDVQREKELVERLGVEHVPTLVLYRDGIRLFQQPGYVDAEGLQDIVQQAESLDMDEVRASLGSSQSSEQGKAHHQRDRTQGEANGSEEERAEEGDRRAVDQGQVG